MLKKKTVFIFQGRFHTLLYQIVPSLLNLILNERINSVTAVVTDRRQIITLPPKKQLGADKQLGVDKQTSCDKQLGAEKQLQ